MIFGIIDYGMGNLSSVKNAFEAVGAEARVYARGADLDGAGAYVVPGVGAFGRGMDGLRSRGFVDALEREVREKRKAALGICLGMQLFAERGEELGNHAGLGWMTGTVSRFSIAPELRVPHVGWNDVHGKGPLFAGIPEETAFYFVHSYHFVPSGAAKDSVAGTTDYGGRFVSMVHEGNIFGVQFHPEKSHKHGLALIKNFVTAARSC